MALCNHMSCDKFCDDQQHLPQPQLNHFQKATHLYKLGKPSLMSTKHIKRLSLLTLLMHMARHRPFHNLQAGNGHADCWTTPNAPRRAACDLEHLGTPGTPRKIFLTRWECSAGPCSQPGTQPWVASFCSLFSNSVHAKCPESQGHIIELYSHPCNCSDG